MPCGEPALHRRGELLKGLRRRLARAVLRLLRWRNEGEPPELQRYVLIAAPHTSNWDFLFVVLFMWALEIRLSFLAKHTLFWWPQGVVLRWLGGLPVDRSARHDLVARLAERFADSERLVVLIPPEGTRGRAEHWKSGFYQVARSAGVPVVAATLHWPMRLLSLSGPLAAGEDPSTLMDALRAIYRGVEGRHPERVTPVRLKQEGAPPP